MAEVRPLDPAGAVLACTARIGTRDRQVKAQLSLCDGHWQAQLLVDGVVVAGQAGRDRQVVDTQDALAWVDALDDPDARSAASVLRARLHAAQTSLVDAVASGGPAEREAAERRLEAVKTAIDSASIGEREDGSGLSARSAENLLRARAEVERMSRQGS